MRTLALCLALTGLIVTGVACATKTVPVPVVSTPRFPDFLKPTLPPALAATQASVNFDRGWLFLQAGDLNNADRELSLALQGAPDFYPAHAAQGYVAMARKDPEAALTRFDRALRVKPDEVSALVGKGEALAALSRESEAVTAFEAALAVDSSLVDLRRRVEVLRFRGVERDLADARQAARANRFDEAIRIYRRAIATSPESAFLYRELASIERRSGDFEAALTHFRQATSMDPADAASLVEIGEMLDATDDWDGALAAYASALAIEPNPVVESKRLAVLAAKDRAALPAEFVALETAPQATRADLAAMIGLRLTPVLTAIRPRDAVVITDVRANWAESWIMAVIRAGVMDAYENHTFQPSGIVRRVDLAQVVSRLLTGVATVNPAIAQSWQNWQNARGRFSDIAAGHLAYPAASVAVAAGILTTGPSNAFEPARPVTGPEVLDAIARLEKLAKLPARSSTSRP